MRRGAQHQARGRARRPLTGVDISETFVRHAAEAERNEPLGVRYGRASAVELPFESAAFDFATAFMSLMDIPETDRVLAEVFRVLRPGGFFQFSIEHPCFATPHGKTLRDERGRA
jgi:ubiquinone/menaquinone biosynthesis C-methylase UbiE